MVSPDLSTVSAMSLTSVVEEMRSQGPWAMEPEALSAFARRLASLPLEAAARGADDSQAHASTSYEVKGGTAVINVSGVLMKKVPSWYRHFGIAATSTPGIAAAVESAANDPRVSRIVLSIDSPGGQASGVGEAADSILAARKRKPVYAAVESLAASGAYWLAAQADQITASPDALVGSIGVYQVWLDFSAMAEKEGIKVHVVRSGEHKGAGVMGAPITDANLEVFQQVVDGLAEQFVAAVAKGRRKSTDAIKAFATGAVWLTEQAKTHGLVDSSEPFTRAMNRWAPTSEVPMSEQANPSAEQTSAAAVKAALESERKRFSDLKSAFPEDAAFAAKAFEDGKTVEQASVEYVNVLRSKLNEKPKGVVTAPAQVTAAPVSAPPITGSKDPAQTGSVAGDFMAQAEAYAADKGVSITKAMSAVANKNPGLHRAYKASCAERAGELESRKRALGIR